MAGFLTLSMSSVEVKPVSIPEGAALQASWQVKTRFSIGRVPKQTRVKVDLVEIAGRLMLLLG